MATRTCLFDLGNVLMLFSHDRMCAQVGRALRRSADEVRAALLDSGLQARFECGATLQEVHRELDEQLGSHSDPVEFERACAAIFEPNHGMAELLADIKRTNTRLVLLSNTCRSHYEYIRERFDVLNGFHDFVLSYEVGAMKPDDSIYEAALRKIQCDPSECFYTDDIPEYVAAARNFGLDAEVFLDAMTTRRLLQQRGVVAE